MVPGPAPAHLGSVAACPAVSTSPSADPDGWGSRVYAARGATQRKLAELTAYLQEVLGISGALLIKAFVRERAEQERFRQTNDELRHLEIRARDGRIYAVDLGSTNGSYVNGQRITAPTTITMSDTVRIGKTILKLEP